MTTNSYLLSLVLAVLLVPASASAQQKDVKGCNDHPLFTRMDGYWIQSCSEKQFDEHAFEVGGGKKETIGGRVWVLRYRPVGNQKSTASEVQILRNFENAVTKLGGSVLSSAKSGRTMKVARDGKEFWVELRTDWTGMYGFTIVQREGMAQTIEANADVFSNDLKNTGRAAVYGIYFDTGRADLKPESEPALAEIARLLKQRASLRLHVIGHTDNVGDMAMNMDLSKRRAAAVAQALATRHGVAAARLRPDGVGPLAPVASNKTEEGRARNRRVELVEQ